MFKATSLQVLDAHRVEIEFSDGSKGVVDLSDLIGKGVFKRLQDENIFRTAEIRRGRSLSWGDDIDLCVDALYLQVTGKTVGALTDLVDADA